MRVGLSLLLLVAIASAADEVTAHRLTVLTGQYVDLDTATVMSRPRIGELTAEFRLTRSGHTFTLEPVARTVFQAGEGREAPADGYGRIGPQINAHQNGRGSWFAITRSGRYARMTLEAGRYYQLGIVSLRFDYNHAGTRAFPDRPLEPVARWADGVLHVAWKGEPGRFVVTAADATVTVDGNTAELRGLDAGVLHTVRVRRVADGGLLSAPAVTALVAGPRRVRRGVARFEGRWHNRGGGLDLRNAKAFADDADLEFFLYGVYTKSGGVQHMGKGLDVYRNLQTLPTTGYRSFHTSLRDGDVFAVRTADGRYGKVLVLGDGGDYRDGMIVRCTFLESGGHVLPPRPDAVTWKRSREGLRLQWPAVTGARGYRVRRAAGAILYEGPEPECVLRELAPNATHPLEVSAVHADGLESEPAEITVNTYPARFKVGRFTLDSHGRNGWSFTDHEMVHRRDGGEMYISNSAGGASSLSITAAHGIGRPDGHQWARLPHFGDQSWHVRNKRINTDDRDPPSQTFCARSAEGGVACLRIVHADHPLVTFEYIYRPPLWAGDGAVLKGKTLTWKPLAGAKAYRVRVAGKELDVGDATEVDLPALPRNAFCRIELIAILADGEPTEPFVLETHTFSDAYRLGKITTVPWGVTGVSLVQGRAVQHGHAEFDLGFRLSGRNEVKIVAPHGSSLVHGYAYGSFPGLGADPGLLPERTVAIADLVKAVLLIRTADGGYATVRVRTAGRRRQFNLEFVHRQKINLDRILEAIAGNAPPPTDVATKRATGLLGQLAAKDPRRRERALQGLVKLGLEGARVVLAARETAKDPDVHALLKRWALEVYRNEIE